MAIIKEKKIKVISVIEELSDEGLALDSERCEMEYDAFFKIDGENFDISYSEMSEGGKIVSDIILFDGKVSVIRRGAIESDFHFAEGYSEKTVYKMPPYSFDAEITTKKIRNNLTRVGGNLSIFYEMNIGGAKKRVLMRILVPEDRI